MSEPKFKQVEHKHRSLTEEEIVGHCRKPARLWAERLIQEERERILDMPMLFVADIDALLVHTKSLALHYNKYAATDTEVRERLSFIVALATDLLESLYPGESEQ